MVRALLWLYLSLYVLLYGNFLTILGLLSGCGGGLFHLLYGGCLSCLLLRGRFLFLTLTFHQLRDAHLGLPLLLLCCKIFQC